MVKLLAIPSCQHVVIKDEPRLCGQPSIAVLTYDDGSEHFTCEAHRPVLDIHACWGLKHRRAA